MYRKSICQVIQDIILFYGIQFRFESTECSHFNNMIVDNMINTLLQKRKLTLHEINTNRLISH